MSAAESLSQRIKAEFESREAKLKQEAARRAQDAQDRERRLAQFSKVCDELKSVWGPRIEEFAKQFGDKIKVTPNITPSQREAKVVFLTELASVTLTLTASTSADMSGLVLDYDLLIVPMFIEYERHARLEMPLDKVDREAVGKWFDDRLIGCVKAYLTLQDNEFYQKRAMVEDPITKARFLPADAAAKLEHNGQTVYFKTQQSMVEYKQKHQLPA